MSSSTQTWKTLLGFTERFAVIDQIASFLKLDPAVQHSQALKSAQTIETECFNGAYSQEDYIRTWKAKLEDLRSRQNPPDSPVFSPPTPNYRSSSPSLDPSSGSTLGTYTSCHHHASGLFSTIYKAYPPPSLAAISPTKTVALKLTNPTTMTPPHDSRREARILTAVAGHVNIVPLLDTFTLPPSSFVLVFPFYKYDLAVLLREDPDGLSVSQRVAILKDTASALKWVHERGVLHRDVKPSNILLSADPLSGAVLADFGIAWMQGDQGSERAEEKITDVGTTCYRPPELLFGWKSYGTGLDMWAFGCVVAECFMGEVVRSGEGEEVYTFFDAGDLGSELRLVGSIFGKLGTPSVETWPEAARFPDFGKILFHQFPTKSWMELLPDASDAARDLVGRLLVYESGARLSAAEVLEHALFRT